MVNILENSIKLKQVIGGWIWGPNINMCFRANVIDFWLYCCLMPQGHTMVYSPFLFTTASLQIMPGCKLQLLQAETTWLVAMKGFTRPIIAVTVFMDIGFCFYTRLSSQLVVKLKPCIPQTATHPSSQRTPVTKPNTSPGTDLNMIPNTSKCFFSNSALSQQMYLYFSVISFSSSITFPWWQPVILLILFYHLFSFSVYFCMDLNWKEIAGKSGNGVVKDRMKQWGEER